MLYPFICVLPCKICGLAENIYQGFFTNHSGCVRYGTGILGTYRYGCRTELTDVSGTGIDVVPNLPKCPVPVLMNYEVSSTGIDVPNIPKYPVPVVSPYRAYRSVWYRY